MIDELYRRLGPPRPPRPIDWGFAERRLGTALPAEVKALVDRYGPGHLGGVIELLSPAEPRSARNLVVQVRRHSFDTSPIGLLVLANDADGRPLRWQRIGEPDAWPILIDFEPVEGTLTELLLAALDRRGPLPLRTGPPPSEPEPDVQGVDVAAALRLPSDFRALIERYGSGELQDELFLFSPERVEQALDAARAMQPHFLDPVTDEPAYRVWPEPGGLLPWAGLVGATVFHWHTEGEPDEWPGVLEDVEAGAPAFWAFDGGAAELLLGLFSGALDVPLLRD